MNVTISTRDADDNIEITLSTVPFANAQKKAYWGWMSTNGMLVEPQIVVLQGSGNFNSGATIVADFRGGNASPMYLFMAERASEPPKTQWWVNSLDTGAIGPSQTFEVAGTVNGWRVYRSTFKTQFSAVTEFRVS